MKMNFLNPNQEIRTNIVVTPFSSTTTIPPNRPIPPDKNRSQSKMKWGAPTWYLFHALAEKVNPETFEQIRITLLQTIYTICINLPCPDCSKHAKSYLDSYNFNLLRSRDSLKHFLFHFHNSVNARKGIPAFSETELNEKYSNINLVNTIHHFMYFFENKHHAAPQMITDDLFRSRVAANLKQWFKQNLSYFMP
jgi:hypothetical protein